MDIYEKSIQAIRDYDHKLSVSQWNIIAKKYGYLSAKSLTIISGKNFNKLNNTVRKKWSKKWSARF